MGAPMAPRPIQAMDGVVVMGCSSDRRAGGDRRWVAVGGRAWASAGDGGGEGVDHVSQGLLAADIAGEDHVRHAHDLLGGDRKSTRLNSSHVAISYAVFCLKKKNNI